MAEKKDKILKCDWEVTISNAIQLGDVCEAELYVLIKNLVDDGALHNIRVARKFVQRFIN